MTLQYTMDLKAETDAYRSAVDAAYSQFAEDAAYHILEQADKAVEAGLRGEKLQTVIDNIVRNVAEWVASTAGDVNEDGEVEEDDLESHRSSIFERLDRNGGGLIEVVEAPLGGQWGINEDNHLIFVPEGE